MWNYLYKTFKFDFVGLATLMAVFILKIPGLDTEDEASVLDWVFSIISPTYCLGSGILNVYINYGFTEVCKTAGYPSICLTEPTSPCCSGMLFNYRYCIQ
jgi:energy-converting hydrogenase Eha subunit A